MRKKTLLLVIVLMSISLVGLIGFQAYWIQHAVQMEEEVFDRNVTDALHQVVRRLETKEAVLFLKEEAPQLRKAALSTVAAPVAVEVETEPDPVHLPKRTRKARTDSPLDCLLALSPSKNNEPAKIVGPARVVAGTERVKIASATPARRAESLYNGKDTGNRIIIRSARTDSSGKPAQVRVFGQSKLDSIVIWRVLAAQAKQSDSIVNGRSSKRILLPRKSDSTIVVRVPLDSLHLGRPIDALKHIPVNSIKAVDIKKKVGGSVINVVTDSVWEENLTKEFTYTIATDTTRRIFHRGQAAFRTATPARAWVKRLEPSTVTIAPVTARASTAAIVSAKKAAKEQTIKDKAEAKAQHLNQVMEKMAAEYVRKEKPLKQRLDELELEKLLAIELKNRDIYTPYELQIETGEEENFIFANNRPELPSAAGIYQVRLFPNDVLTVPSYLKLNFPGRQAVVWQSLLVPTFISGLFTLIIIITFYFTLSTILRQKKISEIKNDFINNMTHEFKTPIATISLALDALVNPKVRKDEVRVDFYARIIRDENKRMHHQVEKVLQTAQMERNKLQLAFEPVDVHELIKKAAEPFQLHIEQRQGVLDLKLDASNPVVWADPGHLANMIANLLDNANKYSPNAPKIVVQTSMISKGLHISVEDQGAGMSREAQKKVFDKFYRVHTGNVHNVKGFGLGLSYVKTMVEAHAGSIHLRSELGKGSKFTLWLPSQKTYV